MTSELTPASSIGAPSGPVPVRAQRLTTSATSSASMTFSMVPVMTGFNAMNRSSAGRIASSPLTCSPGCGANVATGS